jgi:hypothetical protein
MRTAINKQMTRQTTRWIPVLSLLLVAEGITGCVSTNAPDPTVVSAALNIDQAAVTATSNAGGNNVSYVMATAAITSSGVYAKSAAVSVFAGIGAAASPLITTSSPAMAVTTTGTSFRAENFPKTADFFLVPGLGALAFTGSHSESAP